MNRKMESKQPEATTMSDLWINEFRWKVRTGQILYWMNEQTGLLKEIVMKFFSVDQELTEQELEILKWYIGQFVDAMLFRPPKWCEKLAACLTKKDLKRYNWWLVSEYAIDPF